MTSFRCLKIDDLFKIVLVPEDIDIDIDNVWAMMKREKYVSEMY